MISVGNDFIFLPCHRIKIDMDFIERILEALG